MPGLADFADFTSRPQLLQAALWGGVGLGTFALLFAMRKRWGGLTPIAKCTVFSVWAHVMLVIYATSVQISAGGPGRGNGGDGGRMTVLISTDVDSAKSPTATQLDRQDEPQAADPTIPRTMTFAALRLPTPKTPPTAEQTQPAPSKKTQASPAALSNAASPPTAPPTANSPAVSQPATTTLPASAKTAVTEALTRSIPPPTPAGLPDLAVEPSLADPLEAAARLSPPIVAAEPTPSAPIPSAPIAATPVAAVPLPPVTTPIEPQPVVEPFELPPLYQQRTAANREQIAAAHGGSQRTEDAVNRALRWLADHQEPDGRWNPTRFGAGQETVTLGQDRGGAGAKADTGLTGLALLAMLGAGHTHQRGDYRATVGRGLEFLASQQHGDGNVAGNAEPYAFMYCHGMATLALSEALAMSGDAKLRPFVERAIGYTLRAQNRATGGWRYRPYDQGDTSQLGWQLMALKSAELAGLEFPVSTRQGIERFVASVSSGPQGGLASYRPGEQVSRTMTAEALLVRQFLGQPRQNPAFDEAGNFLLGELPGTAQKNFYYWYYGTLAMYQLQGEHWRRWNDALTNQLLSSQSTVGEGTGSWDPNDLWGGYGGRVYSTALATLCLEVYYRYLPLYVEAASNSGDTSRK
jgi:hypothetical protein